MAPASRRKLTALTIVLSALFTITACSPRHQETKSDDVLTSQTKKDVTVGLTYVPDIQFAPLYVAEAKGYFDQQGLNVTLRHHGAQESLLGALAAGDEDITFAGGDEMMQARSTGIDVVNWATMYQQYPAVLIVPQASGITSWEQMAGKTVGLPGPYGENYYGLLAALQQHGLENEVTQSFIGYTQTAALKNGEVDGVIGFANSDVIALENAGIEVTTIPLSEDELPLVGVGFGSMASNIDEDTYARFLLAVQQGVETAAKDLEGTVDIAANYVPALKTDSAQRELAQKVLEATLKLYQGNAIFGAQNSMQWEDMAVFMLEQKLIEQAVDPQEAFTQDIVTAAQKLK